MRIRPSTFTWTISSVRSWDSSANGVGISWLMPTLFTVWGGASLDGVIEYLLWYGSTHPTQSHSSPQSRVWNRCSDQSSWLWSRGRMSLLQHHRYALGETNGQLLQVKQLEVESRVPISLAKISNFSGFLDTSTTFICFSANWYANSLPIPSVHPVTTRYTTNNQQQTQEISVRIFRIPAHAPLPAPNFLSYCATKTQWVTRALFWCGTRQTYIDTTAKVYIE